MVDLFVNNQKVLGTIYDTLFGGGKDTSAAAGAGILGDFTSAPMFTLSSPK